MATFIIGGILGYIDIAFMSLWQLMSVIGVNHDKQLQIVCSILPWQLVSVTIIKGNSEAMVYSPLLIPGNATLCCSETDLSNNTTSLTLPQRRLVWGNNTTGCSSQTSNLLILLCEEAQKVLVNISSSQSTCKGGGIHMSMVVTMTTVTSARFFVAMTTFSMLT